MRNSWSAWVLIHLFLVSCGNAVEDPNESAEAQEICESVCEKDKASGCVAGTVDCAQSCQDERTDAGQSGCLTDLDGWYRCADDEGGACLEGCEALSVVYFDCLDEVAE